MPWGSCSNLMSDTTSIVPTLYISGRQCGHWPFAQQCLQQSLFLDVAVCISFDPKKQQALNLLPTSMSLTIEFCHIHLDLNFLDNRCNLVVLWCFAASALLDSIMFTHQFIWMITVSGDRSYSCNLIPQFLEAHNFGVTSGNSIVFHSFWRLDTHPHRQQPSRLRLVYQVV